MDLLFVTDGDKWHYVYIKDFDRFMFHKTKSKNKKWFCRSCLQCFSNRNVLTNHKENFLSINGAQSVKLGKRVIEFKNYCRQMHCPFRIYCNFECNLEGSEIYEGFYTKKKNIIIFRVVLLTNLIALMIDLVKQLLFLEVKTLLMNLSKQFLRSMNTVKK